MYKLVIYSIVAFVILLFNIQAIDCDNERDIQVIFNPNCTIDDCKETNTSSNNNNLLYIKSTGASDIIHLLYSTIGSFTILLFKTDLNAIINVNWTTLITKNQTQFNNSITFDKPINESAAYLFPLIYEFNDDKGTADMTKIPNNQSYWNIHETMNMTWSFELSSNKSDTIGIFKGKDPNTNGTYNFIVRYYGQTKRDKYLPHLLVSEQSTSLDFVIDSVKAKFKDSKFALNTLFVSSNKNYFQIKNRKSLDDEYTPGTFQQWTVDVIDNKTSTVHNYLQWKPIFYFTDDKTLENSTQTKHYPLNNNQKMPLSVANSFYYDENAIALSSLNISFGLEGDEKDGYFFIQTNYSSFTFSLGLGEPAAEKMSTIVTLVIFIGFGLPALVIVVGLFVLLVRKMKNSGGSRSGYEQL